MAVTEKQKAVLRKAGLTDEQIAELSYEEVSAAIGKILTEAPKNPYKKEVKSPNVVSEYKKPYDNVSYYVAYAKDLCIAMLAAHVERLKMNSSVEPIAVGALMTEAIFEVKKAKMAFEATK